MEENNRAKGSRYEDRAAAFLENVGMTILERNYRCKAGEIDIIARDDKTVCFVEVKFRNSLKSGFPAEAVGIRKQQRIYRRSEERREKNGVVWLEFKSFAEKGFPLLHAYSTRLGGVSTGAVGSMNLRNCEYDSRDNYERNMLLFFDAVGFTFDNIVASHQTHTNNVHVVRSEDVPTGTLYRFPW